MAWRAWHRSGWIVGFAACSGWAGACRSDRVAIDDTGITSLGTESGPTSASDGAPWTTGFGESTSRDGAGELDFWVRDLPPAGPPDRCDPYDCPPIDVLLVVDDSSSMAHLQHRLGGSFPRLINALTGITDPKGNPLVASYHVMVTTGDMGHPLCNEQQLDSTPRRGAPVYSGCNGRANHFVGPGPDPVNVLDACTTHCPVDVTPDAQFVAFDPFMSNVLDDRVSDAVTCIGLQGIAGCTYEAPLESMAQALGPSACWNAPEAEACQKHPEWGALRLPFLRKDSIVAIVIVTDEVECSVAASDGFQWFTERDDFWSVDPRTGNRTPSEAICANAGVDCDDVEGDGLYEGCHSAANGVLHPTWRYTDLFSALATEEGGGHEIVMLGILGVPPVLARDPATRLPTLGGLPELVYRDWVDGEIGQGGDILPSEWAAGITAADKRFELGPIAPGCTTRNDAGEITGQAFPNTRIIDVCQSLDVRSDTDGDGEEETSVRCCIESICAPDFRDSFGCLQRAIASAVAERRG